MALDALHGLRDLRIIRDGCAGDAIDRDIIDKARGIGEHLGQALVVGGGGGEADEVHARFERGNAELRILLRRQIDHDQPIDASGCRVRQKAFNAIDIDGVVVAHQHDGRMVVLGAKGGDKLQGPDHGPARFQRAQARRLDRRPIRHGVGEGHPDLDDVSPRARQGLKQLQGCVEVRIPAHEIGHEGRAAFGTEFAEAFVDTSGHGGFADSTKAGRAKAKGRA